MVRAVYLPRYDKTGLATSQNKNAYCLKKKYNAILLKPFNTNCNLFMIGDVVNDIPDCAIDEELPLKLTKMTLMRRVHKAIFPKFF